MFSNIRAIIICNITSITDSTTGNRTKIVESGKYIAANKQLVGIMTQQLAQAQNMNFSYSVEVDKMFYNNQKYLYMDNTLYEIKNISPAKDFHRCKLNVQALQDSEIKEAIERWINDLQ